jgi:hypothetical protein
LTCPLSIFLAVSSRDEEDDCDSCGSVNASSMRLINVSYNLGCRLENSTRRFVGPARPGKR